MKRKVHKNHRHVYNHSEDKPGVVLCRPNGTSSCRCSNCCTVSLLLQLKFFQTLLASGGSRRTRTHGGSAKGRSFRQRTRQSVDEIYHQLCPLLYFRRAFRMKFETFQRLADELCPAYILKAAGHKEGVP